MPITKTDADDVELGNATGKVIEVPLSHSQSRESEHGWKRTPSWSTKVINNYHADRKIRRRISSSKPPRDENTPEPEDDLAEDPEDEVFKPFYDQIVYKRSLEHECPERSPRIVHVKILAELNIERLGIEQMRIAQSLAENKRLSPEEMERLSVILREQAQAVRDYEYMINHLQRPFWKTEKDIHNKLDKRFPELSSINFLCWFEDYYRNLPKPDHLTTNRLLQAIHDLLPDFMQYTSEEKKDDNPHRQFSKTTKLIASITIALVGAVVIILPILVMSFHTSKTKSLITISISTLLFGFASAVILGQNGNDVFDKNAKYAAILVVFVGLQWWKGSNPSGQAA